MQYGNHVWVDLFFITFWGLLIIFFKMRLFTVWIRSKFQRITEECVFLIVIWPEFHTGQYWFDILATHASLQLLLTALVSLLCYWIRNNLTLSWDPTRTGDPHARHLHFDIFPFLSNVSVLCLVFERYNSTKCVRAWGNFHENPHERFVLITWYFKLFRTLHTRSFNTNTFH